MSTKPSPPPQDDADLLQRVSDLVLAVPGVAELHPGMFGEVATYLPGTRIKGIRRLDDGVVEVHIATVYGPSVLDVAESVRAAVEPVTSGPVLVVVEDVIEVGSGV